MQGITGHRVLSDIFILFYGSQSQEKIHICSMHMPLKLDLFSVI